MNRSSPSSRAALSGSERFLEIGAQNGRLDVVGVFMHRRRRSTRLVKSLLFAQTHAHATRFESVDCRNGVIIVRNVHLDALVGEIQRLLFAILKVIHGERVRRALESAPAAYHALSRGHHTWTRRPTTASYPPSACFCLSESYSTHEPAPLARLRFFFAGASRSRSSSSPRSLGLFRRFLRKSSARNPRRRSSLPRFMLQIHLFLSKINLFLDVVVEIQEGVLSRRTCRTRAPLPRNVDHPGATTRARRRRWAL